MNWDTGTIFKVNGILSQWNGKVCVVRWTLDNLAEGKVIYPSKDLPPWDLQISQRAEMLCTSVRAQFPGSIQVVTLNNDTNIAYIVEMN